MTTRRSRSCQQARHPQPPPAAPALPGHPQAAVTTDLDDALSEAFVATFSLEDETAATPSLGSSEAGQGVRPREAEEEGDGEVVAPAAARAEPAPTESRGRRARRRRGRRRERNAPQPANQAVAGQREELNSPEAQDSPEPAGSAAERAVSEESDSPHTPEVKISEPEVNTMVGTVDESSPARRTRSSVAASLQAPCGENAGMMVRPH